MKVAELLISHLKNDYMNGNQPENLSLLSNQTLGCSPFRACTLQSIDFLVKNYGNQLWEVNPVPLLLFTRYHLMVC